MLMNYPSFFGKKEQTNSKILFNNIKLLIQTHCGEIWYDLDFGTTIRDKIKQGIDNIVISEIEDELSLKLNKYFKNDITVDSIDIWQDVNKVMIVLKYTELRTGKHLTMQSEEVIINDDNNLY